MEKKEQKGKVLGPPLTQKTKITKTQQYSASFFVVPFSSTQPYTTTISNLHQSHNTTKSPSITISRHNYSFQEESQQQTKRKETNREKQKETKQIGAKERETVAVEIRLLPCTALCLRAQRSCVGVSITLSCTLGTSSL
jgi:hypothetical protein